MRDFHICSKKAKGLHRRSRFWKSHQGALYRSGFSSQAHCFKVLHHFPNPVTRHRRLNSTFFEKRPNCKSCIVLKWLFDAPRITLLQFSSAPPAIRPTHKDTDRRCHHIFLKRSTDGRRRNPVGRLVFTGWAARARGLCWRLFCSPAFCHMHCIE